MELISIDPRALNSDEMGTLFAYLINRVAELEGKELSSDPRAPEGAAKWVAIDIDARHFSVALGERIDVKLELGWEDDNHDSVPLHFRVHYSEIIPGPISEAWEDGRLQPNPGSSH